MWSLSDAVLLFTIFIVFLPNGLTPHSAVCHHRLFVLSDNVDAARNLVFVLFLEHYVCIYFSNVCNSGTVTVELWLS